MKCELGNTVHWQGEDGRWKVGRIVLANGIKITANCGIFYPEPPFADELVQVQVTDLEFVEYSKLRDCPSEPIVQPRAAGRPIPSPEELRSQKLSVRARKILARAGFKNTSEITEAFFRDNSIKGCGHGTQGELLGWAGEYEHAGKNSQQE